MDATLRWFVYLCLEKKLLQRSTLNALRKTAKIDETAPAYAEMLLDIGILPDRQTLDNLLAEARAKGETRPPADPFSAPAVPRTPPPPVPAKLAKPPPAPAPADPPAPAPPAPPTSPETVVEAGGTEPALPDFTALAGASPEVFRHTMIALLRHTTASGASDLHLSAGARPFVRRDRKNEYIAAAPLSAETAAALNSALLSEADWTCFQQHHDFDFALPFSTGERFRANLMRHRDGCAGTYRAVPASIRSLAALGFRNPQTIDKLLSFHNGLILVTGPVGSGKTTTLAALVDQLNRTRDDHLVSVESPIEFVHEPNRCIVTQRGVGQHTESFRSALKGALRQDPDIIVIGEMRDLETIEMAITASETGHLVIGTMHTSDAATTLNRLLDVFPPAQQPQIRAMVGESLRGIVCQRLLSGKQGGLVLASEILIRNTAVSALIREGKTEGLGNVMETGKADGMIAMDASILELWREGKITDETALANLRNETAGRQIRQSAAVPDPSPTPAAEPKKRGLFPFTR